MTPTEHKRRRRQLMRMMGPDSIAILPTAVLAKRNRDVLYPYRPDSDFFYLTDFPEPDLPIIINNFMLFSIMDEQRELWDGPRAGQEGARELYGADDSFPIEDMDEILPGMLEGCDRVFFSIGCNPDLDKRLSEWIKRIRCAARSGVQGPQEFVALDHYLHDMRLYKSPAEIRVMRKAAKISAAAHRSLMEICRPGMMEYELEAAFGHQCAINGARHQAYSPIVGGGGNACVLHYIDNRDPLKDGDLVLVDAGCEYEYYASDITRTFPVSGRFSEPQRQLYELVLAAQQAAIAKVRPGNHWNDPHLAAVRTITRGLIGLGILKGRMPKLIKDEAYKHLYMHRTGHWLGMDVHDVGDYKVDGAWRLLEPGMVMTVEPGLYIPAGTKGVARKWWNIGIRIEDDVLVARDGNEVLTKDVPKSIQEIEGLRQA